MSKSVVKKIEKKKGLYLIHLEEEDISLGSSFYEEELLYIGKLLSNNDCIRLRHLSLLSEPYEYSRRLLSRGAYSSHSLREKINIKYPDFEDTNEVIYRLKEQGLIDDEGYAEGYKEAKEASLYGPRKIYDELRYKKGINPEILEKMEFTPEEEALDKLFPLIDRRYKDLPYKSKVQKLEKLMIDRGFSERNAKEYAAKASVDKKEQAKRFQADLEKAKRLYSKKYEGYELKQRIIRSLLSKGYTMDTIKEALGI